MLFLIRISSPILWAHCTARTSGGAVCFKPLQNAYSVSFFTHNLLLQAVSSWGNAPAPYREALLLGCPSGGWTEWGEMEQRLGQGVTMVGRGGFGCNSSTEIPSWSQSPQFISLASC